jgi:hypothetical protein
MMKTFVSITLLSFILILVLVPCSWSFESSKLQLIVLQGDLITTSDTHTATEGIGLSRRHLVSAAVAQSQQRDDFQLARLRLLSCNNKAAKQRCAGREQADGEVKQTQYSSPTLQKRRESYHHGEDDDDYDDDEYDDGEREKGSDDGEKDSDDDDDGYRKDESDDDREEDDDDNDEYEDDDNEEKEHGSHDNHRIKDEDDTRHEPTSTSSSSSFNLSSWTATASSATSQWVQSATWSLASSLLSPSVTIAPPTQPTATVAQPTMTPQRVNLLSDQVVRARQRALDAARNDVASSTAFPSWQSPHPGDAFAAGDQIQMLWSDGFNPSSASYSFQLRICVLRASMDIQNARSGSFGDGACGLAVNVNSSVAASGAGWQVAL